ncbi:MAG: VOC family protein [Acidobacteriia bacterium]|nr:VOC family protein [Terriglobia bacterium]
MPKVKFDHVSFLVRDLDATIKDYQQMLAVLDPEQAKQIVWGEGVEQGYKLRWATFVNPHGAALQFFESENPYDLKLLEKYGERVHHIAFTSDDIRKTVSDLDQAGIPLTSKELSGPGNMPWLKWTFVPPKKAHGVLIEVATRYKVENGQWVKDY